MSLVEIVIGQSRYTIECEEDQKSQLTKLATKLDRKFNDISKSLPNIDEKTILVISALMTESDLEDLKNNSSATTNKKTSNNKDEIYDALSKKTQNVCQQIDELANKIQNS